MNDRSQYEQIQEVRGRPAIYGFRQGGIDTGVGWCFWLEATHSPRREVDPSGVNSTMPAVALSQPPDTSLVRAEFHRLVDRTARRLYRLAARLTGSEAEGADVLQEAYLKAFDASQRHEFVMPANVDAWLYGIVTHLALNSRRGAARAKIRNEAWLLPSVDAVRRQEARLALLELNELLSVLPVEQRAALVLKEFEGLSTREAAAALAVSEGAVEQRLVRARARLKEVLGHD